MRCFQRLWLIVIAVYFVPGILVYRVLRHPKFCNKSAICVLFGYFLFTHLECPSQSATFHSQSMDQILGYRERGTASWLLSVLTAEVVCDLCENDLGGRARDL